MHLPDKWGMLQFSTDDVNTTAPVYNPEWTVRYVAMQVCRSCPDRRALLVVC